MKLLWSQKKAVESVDVIADAVLGSHAKQETAEALKTLHKVEWDVDFTKQILIRV